MISKQTDAFIHPSTHPLTHSPIYSFIRSGYFYSASWSPILLRGAPDTALTLLFIIFRRSFRSLLRSLLFIHSFIHSLTHSLIHSFTHPPTNPNIHSFIRSGYFYSASSSPILLIFAPDTARTLTHLFIHSFIHTFIHSFIHAISIAPLQVHYYSEALPTQHGYCVGVSPRSATGICEWSTCPRSLRGG